VILNQALMNEALDIVY